MRTKSLIGGWFLFLCLGFASEVTSPTETFFSYFKESCRGEKGWHAEYSIFIEEKNGLTSKNLSGNAELLLLCPSFIRFSFTEKNNVFEFVSDSVQAWIVRKIEGENFRRVEQYNSLSKRSLNAWMGRFSSALDLKKPSFGEFNNLFLVEKLESENKKIRSFLIKQRKTQDQLVVDFGKELEPRFDEISFDQKSYSLKLKFKKEINDQKSSDLKTYNFYAQPEDIVTVILDKVQ
jgi:hypothetical protein